jgi:hypothetical protein
MQRISPKNLEYKKALDDTMLHANENHDGGICWVEVLDRGDLDFR